MSVFLYMAQYLLLIVSFLGIWLTIIWLYFLAEDGDEKVIPESFPTLDVVVPAFNEEKTILKTLNSLKFVEYPKDKLRIFVSDDGSTDNTKYIVQEFIKENNVFNVSLISDVNSGKGAAINKVLAKSNSDIFVVVDADSEVKSDAFKNMVYYFSRKDIAAVISRVVVSSPKGFLQRMQSFEYIISNMLRRVMNNFGTLAITHGAFSSFRTNILKEVGGFDGDRNNITEDLEIALRLKSGGYAVVMAPDAVGFTVAPDSLSKLWKQRIRWYRGYIFNHLKYKNLFFDKKQGIFGLFQLPVNVIAVVLSIAYFSVIFFNLFDSLFTFAYRSFTIHNYFLENFLNLPTLKEFLLAKNFQIYIPILIAFGLSLSLIIYAHKFFKEKLSSSFFPAISYFIFMPYFTAGNWFDSLRKELFRSKRKW